MTLKMILGLYPTLEDAHQVVGKLTEQGISRDKISVIAADSAKKYMVDVTQPKNEQERTLSGVATGIVAGGIAGAALGLSGLALPGIGPLVVGGPLYGTYIGAVTGRV